MIAGPDEDLVVAETFLKGIEIGVESSLAASERANAAFIAVMSKTRESAARSPFKRVNDCRSELLSKLLEAALKDFRLKCMYGATGAGDGLLFARE